MKLSMTPQAVALSGLAYLQAGRLQASLAQNDDKFVGSCKNKHHVLNGRRQTVHCVVGAWIDQHDVPTTAGGTVGHMIRVCEEKGYIEPVSPDDHNLLCHMQTLHDAAAYKRLATSWKLFRKALKLVSTGEATTGKQLTGLLGRYWLG